MGELCPRKCCPLLRGLHDKNTNTSSIQIIKKNKPKSRFTGQILSKIKSLKRNSKVMISLEEGRVMSKRLVKSLFFATQMVDQVASEMYEPDAVRWQANILGHSFSVTRAGGGCLNHGEGNTNFINTVKSWLRAHEEAQVMMASILVVVGLWWLVRTVLALLINLVCPLLVVLLAVVLVPQLRAPLLGQNYPALANVLHNILTKMAENIKQ